MKKQYYINALLLIAVSCTTGCESNKNERSNMSSPASSIVTLPSGLRYKVLKETKNLESPKKGQQVSVHYTGWLNNGHDEPGTKFDSSIDRGQPFVFQLGIGQVIRGWDEGVALMHMGQTVRLLIPAPLGYGRSGAGRLIPPNADLIFDVELLGAR